MYPYVLKSHNCRVFARGDDELGKCLVRLLNQACPVSIESWTLGCHAKLSLDQIDPLGGTATFRLNQPAAFHRFARFFIGPERLLVLPSNRPKSLPTESSCGKNVYQRNDLRIYMPSRGEEFGPGPGVKGKTTVFLI